MGPGSDEVDEIRQEIDQTRQNLASAVGALAYKADVKNRGKEALEDKKEAVMEKVEDLRGKLPGSGEGEGEGDQGGGVGEKVKDKLPSGADVSEKVDALKEKMPGGVSDAAGKIGEKTPSKDEVKQKAQGVASAVSEHPIAVAAGAVAAGLAAGLAIPETELERQKLKPHAQQARAEATGRVKETVEQVKSGAQDAAASVADAVKEQGHQQGGKIGEIAEQATDKAHEKVSPDTNQQ